MYANEIATGRNWYEADRGSIVRGQDWSRAELHWNDGGYAYMLFEAFHDGPDFDVKARQYMREHGFNA